MEQVLGGVIIGVAATVMLLLSGRVTGISGILGGLLSSKTPDKSWRILFVAGLLAGGMALKFLKPGSFFVISSASPIDYIAAGLLVGFGTLLGTGCTSGHGVCGISRFSPRSLVATATFITTGVISVVIFKMMRGEL